MDEGGKNTCTHFPGSLTLWLALCHYFLPFLSVVAPFCSWVHISAAAAQNFYEIDFSKQFKVGHSLHPHEAKTSDLNNCPSSTFLLSLSTFTLYLHLHPPHGQPGSGKGKEIVSQQCECSWYVRNPGLWQDLFYYSTGGKKITKKLKNELCNWRRSQKKEEKILEISLSVELHTAIRTKFENETNCIGETRCLSWCVRNEIKYFAGQQFAPQWWWYGALRTIR